MNNYYYIKGDNVQGDKVAYQQKVVFQTPTESHTFDDLEEADFEEITEEENPDTQRSTSDARHEPTPPELPNLQQEQLIMQLSPFFTRGKEGAKEYVEKIKTMQSMEITRETSQWYRRGEIGKGTYKSAIYHILYEGGLYTRGLSTWNTQVDF